ILDLFFSFPTRRSSDLLSLFYGMWLFIVANSGVRYDRYHYHGVARVVGVLSIVVVEAEIEILEVALNFVVVETVGPNFAVGVARSEEHTSELQSRGHLV